MENSDYLRREADERPAVRFRHAAPLRHHIPAPVPAAKVPAMTR